MDPAALTRAGRIGRGFLATVTLFVLGAWTFLALTWSCCSSPSASERLGDPWIWCLVATYPVPLAALPPLSRRLRGRPWRWALVPSLLAVIGCTYAMSKDLDPREPGALVLLLPLALPLLACAAYVALRVVRPTTP